MAADSKFQALVIGASGLIGWSVVDQLLQPYPSSSPFQKVTALINRPLELRDSFWPTGATDRPELALVSGVNLLCGDAELEHLLKEKVPDVSSVSHVYYFGKIQEHQFCILKTGLFSSFQLSRETRTTKEKSKSTSG